MLRSAGFYARPGVARTPNPYRIASRNRANTFQKVASCVVVKLMRIRVLGLRTA